ncbi:hypothetical protein [Poritiphilus flavus]|uniref:Secreted protein n=1 Tax=Poritiphilus flavus TaxID=2697053 RepID=A0A6L9EEJ6_9FLAO|nr:hypothetical protein [Poritiphilus flavus]NAS12729.1 hypothetical protein [Poritiphilus flavus]
MKRILFILAFAIFCFQTRAQTDIPRTQPLKIDANNNLDAKNNPKQGTALKIPASFDKKINFNLKDSLMARNVKMLPDRELKQAGHDLKIDPKVGELETGKSDKHYGDMYLGDVRTGGKFVGIVCRDHEYVDGDRVRIYANDHVVEHNILLTGSFKGINLNLEKGFNRLDFEALNQGSSGPNTAQVDVYDDKGQLIYSNKWLLSTGSKASLIIVKDN